MLLEERNAALEARHAPLKVLEIAARSRLDSGLDLHGRCMTCRHNRWVGLRLLLHNDMPAAYVCCMQHHAGLQHLSVLKARMPHLPSGVQILNRGVGPSPRRLDLL